MEYSCIQLNDLPDEILMIIFKKLDNVEVLYSLMHVNKRINKLVHDSIFTSGLHLLRYLCSGYIYPLSDSILNRFCSKILPEIGHKIRWLSLESLSVERILLSTNYPNLFGLSLYNIELETALRLLIGESSLTHIFKNQISSLLIKIAANKKLIVDMCTFLFTYIITTFTNLQYLNFDTSFLCHQRISFIKSSPTVYSSTLLIMHVKVNYLNDCLDLLDGRFNQLHTLYVTIVTGIPPALSKINNKVL
ncbi:unnamed protein product [Rotaria sordida]|uniref:F-box domain-containing protein n=1 Tax=Rotaria sordida TaxID=392033 RepID=A0A815FUR6_9BILA|nr:unnamed protein product [Rotaria sordida]CAF3949828.1 unnamed protein product [Rotaria sordida]